MVEVVFSVTVYSSQKLPASYQPRLRFATSTLPFVPNPSVRGAHAYTTRRRQPRACATADTTFRPTSTPVSCTGAPHRLGHNHAGRRTRTRESSTLSEALVTLGTRTDLPRPDHRQPSACGTERTAPPGPGPPRPPIPLRLGIPVICKAPSHRTTTRWPLCPHFRCVVVNPPRLRACRTKGWSVLATALHPAGRCAPTSVVSW